MFFHYIGKKQGGEGDGIGGVDMPDTRVADEAGTVAIFIADTARKTRMKEEAWQRPNRY
ncbi:hypothetical protein [Nitrosospira sp. Nsp1]|uniref:hypothetical protein n=1 Tax=Nitrosospira sp. Nsp1 TaxID=136547 RepID=UPI000883A5DE|nr:hypothetical protein [Nitrosospira sp. Nsp1]SCX39223.1 hypothetical protein SAMN05720354_102157 [Nitrosospira sp. Nsp1]